MKIPNFKLEPIQPGTLYVVATPIGNLSELTLRAIHILTNVNTIYCEDTRVTLQLLNHCDIKNQLVACHKFNESEIKNIIIQQLSLNNSLALVSDAGYPVISDPGALVVKTVRAAGFNVIAINGANAALNALVISGLAEQHFYFYGFLPVKINLIEQELRNFKTCVDPIIFYASPHRLLQTLQIFANEFPDAQICLAKELTKLHEQSWVDSAHNLFELISSWSEIKGEYVLILKNNYNSTSKPKVSNEQLITEINELIKTNYRLKTAIEMVASKYQFSRNELYQIFHHQKGGK